MCASRAVDCRFEAPTGPLARIRKMAKLSMGEIEKISVRIGSEAPRFVTESRVAIPARANCSAAACPCQPVLKA
jgi:hypothetical protein